MLEVETVARGIVNGFGKLIGGSPNADSRRRQHSKVDLKLFHNAS